MSHQLTLDSVAKPFERTATLSTTELYDELVANGVVTRAELETLEPVGKINQKISKVKRKIRLLIMDLKQKGVIEAAGDRGVWRRAVNDAETDKSLFVAPKDLTVIAYSTDLGVALWGDNRQLTEKIEVPIQLCLTSPPYPLSSPRKYGNPTIKHYINFILEALEPVTRKLADGGSIVLNVSNDIFEPGSPARSTYLERMTIAIEDELGLKLMDRLVWRTNKPPAPTFWACRSSHPFHLKTSYEP